MAMAKAKSAVQVAFEKPVQVVQPVQQAPKGKYAEHALTAQRNTVILQSMLELLRADKDFTDANPVSTHVGFTVTQYEVTQRVDSVLSCRNDPNGFYLPPGSKVQDS